MARIIRYHHEPHKASDVEYEASIIHLTDVISIMSGPDMGTDGLAYRFYDEVLEVLDCTSDGMDVQMAPYHENIRKAETLLDMA
jgi:hypothetical protein